jgi:hypothetical protein
MISIIKVKIKFDSLALNVIRGQEQIHPDGSSGLLYHRSSFDRYLCACRSLCALGSGLHCQPVISCTTLPTPHPSANHHSQNGPMPRGSAGL